MIYVPLSFRQQGDRGCHEKRHIKRGEATLEDLAKAQTVTSGQPGGSTHSDGHSEDQPTVGQNIEIFSIAYASATESLIAATTTATFTC